MARCKVGQLVGSTHHLTHEDRTLLRTWVDQGTDSQGRPVPAQAMAAALGAVGQGVGSTTLKDHKGRRCVCWREGEA